MKKLLVSLLALGGSTAFAADYTNFQAFDNQVSVGYGLQSQSTSPLGQAGNNTVSTSNLVQLEGERLLNNGIWINVDAQMVFGQGSTTTSGTIANANLPGSQQPVQNNYGVNGKVGYAFLASTQHFLVTPYVTAGLNNNGIAGDYPTTAAQSTANNLYYTAGIGGRLDFRINKTIDLYADQSATYNFDQSSYGLGVAAQNMYALTSTLGAKFNLTKDFQLGVKGFYTDYAMDANASGDNGVLYPQPQNSVGGLVTLGLTY